MDDEQKVQDFIRKNKPALSISRLDEKTRERFIALANEEFCSDYGMTLKALFERCDFESTIKEILAEIYDLENRIDKIEKTQPNKKVIKTVDGKERVINNV